MKYLITLLALIFLTGCGAATGGSGAKTPRAPESGGSAGSGSAAE